MGVDDSLLSEIVRRVLSVARPDTIILFGSAVSGRMTKDSDIDLLIVDPSPANAHMLGRVPPQSREGPERPKTRLWS